MYRTWPYWFAKLCYQTKFVCLPCSKSDAEMPEVFSRHRYIHKAAKTGHLRKRLRFTPSKVRGLRYLQDKEDTPCLRHGVCRWLEVRERWDNWCALQVHLSYMLLHRMHVNNWRCSVWSEGVFGPLTSKRLSSGTCQGPVLGLVVSASLSQLELNKSWLQVPEKQFQPPLFL